MGWVKGHSAELALQAYSTPHWFRDDWLNRFYDHRQSQMAAAEANASQPDGSTQQAGPMARSAPWQLTGNPLAQSDYRFVYLGVRVRSGCAFRMASAARCGILLLLGPAVVEGLARADLETALQVGDRAAPLAGLERAWRQHDLPFK
jgi:hypothetical protein